MLIAIGVAAALSASWAPSSKFSLVCTGTQTGLQELGGTALSIPWAETFTVDLAKGTYCSQGCAKVELIAAISPTTMDFANISEPGVSVLRHFQVADGAYQSSEETGMTKDRFRLQKTGICTIKP